MQNYATFSDYLTVQEVAQRLGITPHRVRALIRSGEIAAVRISDRALLVDAISVADHEVIASAPGRPYKAQMALGILWQLSGLNADWLSYQQRHRCCTALRELDCAGLVRRCRKRAHTVRMRVNDSFIGDAMGHLARSGVSALADYGFDLTPDGSVFEGYTDRDGLAFIEADCFGVPDVHGNVVVHVADFFPPECGGLMPEAIVAVDLAESFATRQRSIGQARIEKLLKKEAPDD